MPPGISPSKDRPWSLPPLLATVGSESAVASDAGGSYTQRHRACLGLGLGLILLAVSVVAMGGLHR